MSRSMLLAIIVLCTSGMAGCQFGSKLLRTEHSAYARAIQQTGMEQLLKALVQLRYGEPPAFLQISSISAQHVIESDLGGSTSIDASGGSDLIGARMGLGYSERPTITFTQLKGKEFVTRLMTPISSDEMGLLTQSGWRADRLLRVTVESMNGLGNARRASGPTPSFAPEYESFYAACALMTDLKKEGVIEFEYDLHSEAISDPLPAAAVTGAAAVTAAASDIRFRQSDNGQHYILTRERPVVILRMPALGQDERADRLRELLSLAEAQTDFEFVNADKNPVDLQNEDRQYTTLAFAHRSLYSMLFYLSHSVQVPARHKEEGFVTVTLDEHGVEFEWSEMMADILQVHCTRRQPTNAYIAVKHRGHWFYIRDNDRLSKSTIMMISTIFNLRAGNLPDREPVLTLPVTG